MTPYYQRVRKYLALTVLFVALVGFKILHRRPNRPVLVKWTALAKVEAESTRLNRPIFYDFSADWCSPCRQMAREVFADPEDAAFINEHFVAAQIFSRGDIDDGNVRGEGGELMKKYEVENYPTLVIAHQNEQPIFYRGYGSREKLMTFLRAQAGGPGESK